MRLTRPLAIFDVETTGVDTQTDRIVQLAIIRLNPGRSTPPPFSFLINPGVPIPAEATAVHGISDADVAGKPMFRAIAEQVAGLLRDADLAGYNSDDFDVPLLEAEFRRCGYDGIPGPDDRVYLDAFTIERVCRPRTLENVYAELTGEELGEDAHDAIGDAAATLRVLEAQFVRYELWNGCETLADVERAIHHPYVDRQHRFLLDDAGYLCLCFGKHGSPNGTRLVDVERRDRGYVEWMLRTFDPQAVSILIEYRSKGWRRQIAA